MFVLLQRSNAVKQKIMNSKDFTQTDQTGTTVYQNMGYKNRYEYLNTLAEVYGRNLVFTLAAMLGPNEDFDGLVTALQDYADYF
jgi:hypothetical protein